MRRTTGILLAAAFFFAFGAPRPANAAAAGPSEGPSEGSGPDPGSGAPAYSVARLKVNEGTVRVREGDAGDWVEYVSNMPVTAKSRVSVPAKSDAELQFHGEQFVLLTGGTEVLVRELGRERSVFQLAAGEIRFDLSSKDDFGPVEVVVPERGSVRFDAPGRFWLNSEPGGGARLVVRRGEGIVTAAGGEVRVKEGEEASIGAQVRVAKYAGPPEKSTPPREMTEAETEAGVPPSAAYELRDYGDWVYAPDYGYVWRPRVVVGWSPYYYGRWSWVFPWGWTWVAYEPWGWWPYHYGWWYDDPFFGWVWNPYRSFATFQVGFGFGTSRYYCNNVFYRPANVRIVESGRQVRWVPLRPGERFVPPANIRRGDSRLSHWDRPLVRDTVFVRQSGGSGVHWRDWTAVQRERVSVMPRGVAVGERGQVLGRPELRTGPGSGRGDAPGPRVRGGRPDYGRTTGERVGAPRTGGAPRSGEPREAPPAMRGSRERSRAPAPQREFQRDRQERQPAFDRNVPRGGGESQPVPRGNFGPAPREQGGGRGDFNTQGRGGHDPGGRAPTRDFGDGGRGGGMRDPGDFGRGGGMRDPGDFGRGGGRR